MAEPRQERFLRATEYERLNLDNLTEEECINNFRFRREHLGRLVNCLNLPAYIISGNRQRTTGIEGLCMYLRRLAYPNRLTDLEPLFGVSAEYICVITNQVMQHITTDKSHLLYDLANLNWLNRNRMQYYAHAVANKNVPLRNYWGFIDGTTRGICRPVRNQQDYFSGHKRMHCVKYQSVWSPDGIIASLKGPFEGRRHDAGILRDSNIYQELQQHAVFGPESYVLYGDPAYPLRELLLCPFVGRLTEEQQNFNHRMSTVRQAVEWGFSKVISLYAFLDFKKNQKLLLQDVGSMYKTVVLLTNCHTCLYGCQTS